MTAPERVTPPPRIQSRCPGFLMPHERVVCPKNHPIQKNTWSFGIEPSGAIRCQHREPPRGEVCNEIFFMLLMPGGYKIVASVTSSEAHEMEKQHMDLNEIRDFLGLAWPPKASEPYSRNDRSHTR